MRRLYLYIYISALIHISNSTNKKYNNNNNSRYQSVSWKSRKVRKNVQMFIFMAPFTMIVCGCSMSGKSHFLSNLIKHRHHLIGGRPIKRIIWCCKSKDFAPPDLEKEVEIFEGLPLIQDIDPDTLLIADDMQLDCDKQKELASLFTVFSHHRSISTVISLQNLFAKMAHSRDLSLNTTYLVLFKNIRDKMQFSHLSRQLSPRNSNELQNIYKEATAPLYGYLVMDFNPRQPDIIRYLTNIFNPNFFECFMLSEDARQLKPDQEMPSTFTSPYSS